ncbi:hypothetical protein GCM10010472_51990 [Pseudonocardia halophobica]|uniref:Uncharacterized protein n=1 Tax=Pseudonocardia halophobica TaxID=29401 RepID=A0A9W6NVI2_9PSEU|nr:hypothetical protein [Pseudonocardia halophobica]GLL11335.1 hypothetical protein GCM10017577_24760 [Pseudonocardia halophobica]
MDTPRETPGESTTDAAPDAGAATPDPTLDSVPETADDLTLLRRYEPVLRYTKGELFLPVTVGDYVRRCSLWDEPAGDRKRPGEPLVPAGELTLEGLGEAGRRYRERRLHLRFVQESLGAREVQRWRRAERPRLGGIGRFAAVGVIARLIDVLLRLSLLVRGKVPNGLVAAAHQRARDLTGATYYGRVVRTAGYTVLQYWFFYAFNDWRSTFHGVNDHEADWETVAVYLVPDGAGGLVPAWVAASTHDDHGDDLRRRWDDPRLDRDGTHAVLYPGAGSHSHAFVAGDYVVSVGLPPLRAVLRTLQRVRRWLMPFAPEPGTGGFDIPFIDYARGDGVRLGPGGRSWTAVLVDDGTTWIRDFRGLWGLDTRDSFGGERAPAGPRYERDRTVRRSWADPLGWAGLDKVAATAEEEAAALQERMKVLQTRVDELEDEIETERAGVRGLHAELRFLAARSDAAPGRPAHLEELERRERELAELVAERVRLTEEIDVQADRLAGPRPPGPPDAHLRRPHMPYVVPADLRSRFLRVWAALSIPVLIGGLGALLFWPHLSTLVWFAVGLVLFAVVEAVARRRSIEFAATMAGLAITALVITSGVIALLSGWKIVLAGSLALAALVLLVVNVRELRGR